MHKKKTYNKVKHSARKKNAGWTSLYSARAGGVRFFAVMNEHQRKISEKIRRMSSAEAAKWLIDNNLSGSCFYVASRTWKKPEQLLLGNYYLKTIPHASKQCYESLLSIMSVKKFIFILEKYIPNESEKRDLLKYYLIPSITKAQSTEADLEAIEYIKGKL